MTVSHLEYSPPVLFLCCTVQYFSSDQRRFHVWYVFVTETRQMSLLDQWPHRILQSRLQDIQEQNKLQN